MWTDWLTFDLWKSNIFKMIATQMFHTNFIKFEESVGPKFTLVLVTEQNK